MKDGHTLVPGLASTSGIEVAALKHAEDGHGKILRMVEKRGASKAVTVDLSGHGSEMVESDLLERPTSRQKSTKDVLVSFKPYQINTIRMT
jgi:alpha-mannosidase